MRLFRRMVQSGQPTPAFLAVAAADVALAARDGNRRRSLTKPLLMPALMVNRDRPTQRALALGGIGDDALLGESPAAFLAGLGAFLIGHVAWIAAFRGRPSTRLVRRHPQVAMPYAIAWAAFNGYLWPRTGRDRYPVVAYSTFLAAMALAALDTGKPATAAGGLLFMTSDSLLALERFAGLRLPAHEGAVTATYLAAQALLAD